MIPVNLNFCIRAGLGQVIKCDISISSYIKLSATKGVSCRFADFSKFSVVVKLIAVSGITVCVSELWNGQRRNKKS